MVNPALINVLRRVTIFFRQRTGTVVVLHDFSGDIKKKKKKVFTPATLGFCVFQGDLKKNKKKRSSLQRPKCFYFRVVFTNEQKTGTFPPTGRDPGAWP